MPFDYLHSSVPRCYRNAGEKAEAQYLRELEQRAALLFRLGFDKDAAIRRLRGNLAWDWECNPNPEFVARLKEAVAGVVERIYSKPRPPEKGRRVVYEDLKTPPTD
jgi:hypothetical protein